MKRTEIMPVFDNETTIGCIDELRMKWNHAAGKDISVEKIDH